MGRVIHALCVLVGAEAHDAAVLSGICLEALEDLLAVMENTAALRNMQGVVGRQAALVPLAILPMCLIAVVGLHVIEADVAPIQILLLNGHTVLLLLQ